MKKRVVTAGVLLPLLLLVVLALPQIYTAILAGLMMSIAAYELMWETGLAKHPRLVAYASAMALLVCLWSGLGMGHGWALLGLLLFSCLLLGELLLSHTKLPFEKLAVAFFAGVLIPVLFSALVRIHGGRNGRFFILIPFVLAFLSDTGAYFAGRAFGRRKLAPIISPNKTVEGVIGGVLGAIAGIVLYCLVLQLAFDFEINYWYTPVYGLLGSLGAVFGDLVFSAIKRQTDIKDYGNLIPGHGGILDRFDSMMVVAPLVEVLMLVAPMVR